jgi:hypothetical protein
MKIIDTLLLGQKELRLVLNTFPNAYSVNLSQTSNNTQQYQISLDIDEEDAYYNFILDNFLSMSSTNFLFKIKTDEAFAERMRLRIEE